MDKSESKLWWVEVGFVEPNGSVEDVLLMGPESQLPYAKIGEVVELWRRFFPSDTRPVLIRRWQS